MPDTPSITINKSMLYRGKQEIYSNTYHFSGTTPATDADWLALALAIWNAEAPCVSGFVKFAGYLGYVAGDEHAKSIKDYIADGVTQPAGTQTSGSSTFPPGDSSVWVRWRLPTRNSRGKWNYLRKYFHGSYVDGDSVPTTLRTAMNAYAVKMKDGSLPGGAKICGSQGEVAGDHLVAPFVGFRQLKRTGKRPSR